MQHNRRAISGPIFHGSIASPKRGEVIDLANIFSDEILTDRSEIRGKTAKRKHGLFESASNHELKNIEAKLNFKERLKNPGIDGDSVSFESVIKEDECRACEACILI